MSGPSGVTGAGVVAAAPAGERAPAAALTVTRDGPWLWARFAAAQRFLSWAVVGGGYHQGRSVAWLRVGEADLRPPVDEHDLLRARLAARSAGDAVGLLTSADLDRHVDHVHAWGERAARCVVTVGLGNALRAGDPPGPAGRIGTINLVCAVDEPLADGALLEALALAAEARTLAMCEAAVASRRSGLPATGTGTDCIVVAAPDRPGGARYAGKHTVTGHLIGAAVHAAVARGVAAWCAAAAGGAR